MKQGSLYRPLVIFLLAVLVTSPTWAQDLEETESAEDNKPAIIDREVFNSQLRLDPVEIETAPYQHMNDIVTSHVGVNKAFGPSGAIQFRGSGLNETSVVVDGVSQSDPYSNVPNYSINLDAIENIEVATSGFTAEYGNVRSGVINVTTKGDGGPPKLLNISDRELAPVAAAFAAIVNLRAALDQGEISQDAFGNQVVEAVRGQGITLQRYSEVIEVAQTNSKLQERLVNLAREIADQ